MKKRILLLMFICALCSILLVSCKENKDGTTGKSAYEIAVEHGFIGTEVE